MKKLLLIPVACLVLLLSVYSLCCGQNNPKRFSRWLVQDPASIISNVGKKQLFTFATVGATVSMLSINDGLISRGMREHYAKSGYLNSVNEFGNWKIVTPVSAGIFGASLLTNNTKFQDAAFTSLQSLLMTNLTVNVGKFLFARSRPTSNKGPYDINFAEPGATSFPSGHTATAFALFTPWAMYYPGPLTYSLMAIPVGTAIARVAKGRHWLSDVTAGAAVGIAFGHYLAKKHMNFQSERIQVLPSAGANNVSLTVNFSF